MRIGEISLEKVEAAKAVLRGPIEQTFSTPMALKDRDFVNMRFEQFATLVAWYAELYAASRTMPPTPTMRAEQPAIAAPRSGAPALEATTSGGKDGR